MIRVTPFHPSHFGAICAESRFRPLLDQFTPDYLAKLAAEPSHTIWADGVPVVVGGVCGGVEVWAVFDHFRAPRHSLAIVRIIRRYLSTFGYLYANCAVPWDCRLPERALGFRRREERSVVTRGERTYIHLERVA